MALPTPSSAPSSAPEANSPVTSTQIWLNQNNLNGTKVVDVQLDCEHLSEGELILETDSFGFSANNITYAALGFKMGYWGFFPAEEGYGIVPVWGFATVKVSRHPDIQEGEKVFGYLPMASHWVIKAGKVAPHGFSDIHENRKSISPVYDQYLRCSADPGYDANREAWQLNFRPLYMTSFVLDDYVAELSKGESLLLSSASSKTALGTAQLLKDQKEQRSATYKVIGLTSPANVNMVKATGCYDDVISYSELDKLDKSDTFWLLDFAANGTLINNITQAIGDKLSKVSLIGATDWEAQEKPNPKLLDAEIFFAPSRVKLRQKEWGHDVFLKKYATAWQGFASKVDNTFFEQNHQGTEDIIALYNETLNGNADTKALNVVSFK
ncbi:DUF2855 family protein [Alteromonas sp.]|uniref:DUF2855 family protein n=1 Tax=Alteromonas sp. TaxID=232 RepID=UPI000C5C1496|nr:DUF2855 family protein [Alteromonas sp.]MAI39605.1 hypothetical protein [Alteromonas sp.]|tara:strand:+ start:7106 stop:8251 length:1146 start_codon:yes stop_codon:yes gene_type:complete